MILPDSSAWIAYLRGTQSPAHLRLRQLVTDDADVAITDPVVMEVLAGARDGAHHRQLRRFLHEFPMQPVHPSDDFEAAADLYVQCRRRGTTPRNLVDCLIAAVAIRTQATVLHEDRDFEQLARHVALQTLTS